MSEPPRYRSSRSSSSGAQDPTPPRRPGRRTAPGRDLEPVTGTHALPREEPVTGTFTITRDDGKQPPPRQRAAPRSGRPRQRRDRPSDSRQKLGSPDLFGRVVVAVPAVVLAVVFVDLGGIGWTLLMALLALACASELYRMLEEWHPIQLAGFVVVAGMCLAAHFWGQKYVVGIAAAVLPLSFLGLLYRGDTKQSTLAIASTSLGVLWLGFAFSTGVLLRSVAHGKGLVIDVMVGTFIADIAAYFGGRWFGRHPLAPEISPNKTVEGLFCGGIAAILAVFAAGAFQSWLPHGTALLLGLGIAVMGPIGDLFESMLKRDNGVKDAGTMFGAHGGALDRLDAVTFTIFAVYYIWILVPH